MQSVKIFKVCKDTDPQSLSAPSAPPGSVQRPSDRQDLTQRREASSKNGRWSDVKELTAT